MKRYKVTDIGIVNGKKGEREVMCTLDNDTEIHIAACYESWEQWGGTVDELRCTVDIAECINGWLHGIDDELPAEVYDYISEDN